MKPIALAVLTSAIMGFQSLSYAATSCGGNPSDPLSVTINTQKVIRQNVPPGIFGFTVDWFQFQYAYYRNGAVRPEVTSWLKAFPNALYRYSGGNAMEWSHAVGPVADRLPIYANYVGMAQPLFGPAEFFKFLQDVGGKSVVLLNVVGPQDVTSDPAVMLKDNMDYLAWLTKNGPQCVGGTNCPITSFEVGNELDWEAPTNWSGTTYVNRVSTLLANAKATYPNIKFAVLGKTNPWGQPLDSSGQDFDATCANSIGKYADSVTIHPYYDGYAIPDMQQTIDKLAAKYKAINPSTTVLVTEHGRWPQVPTTGNWEDYWYLASGSFGALSAADFDLMAMNDSNISGAMWHTISANGPWQLFHLNRTNDTVYPSATYWGMRALRPGFLTDTVEVTPALNASTEYWGGYDTRLVAMTNKSGNVSLMGVNRSAHAKAITLNITGKTFTQAPAQINVMQGNASGADNSDAQPNLVQMQTVNATYSSATPFIVCIPPFSTFSIVLGSQTATSQTATSQTATAKPVTTLSTGTTTNATTKNTTNIIRMRPVLRVR